MAEWYVLALLCVCVGFLLGRYMRFPSSDSRSKQVQPYYIEGLNYLLNEQPDEAIDTFIDSLDVNQDTLETHLSLGNLLRKRGEVARAIKVHQNLLARPSLSVEHGQQVQLELARDYMKSGLLDRAELLLRELTAAAPNGVRMLCLEYLVDIYQDEKEWAKAIEAILKMPGRRFGRIAESWKVRLAHFYCELADDALRRSDYLTARRYLRSATGADRQSARPSLLLGQLESQLKRYTDAIKALTQVFYQDPALLSEALPLLEPCYRATGRLESFRLYLEELIDQGASWQAAGMLAKLMQEKEGAIAAANYLAGFISAEPTLKSVEQLMLIERQTGRASTLNSYQLLEQVVVSLRRSSAHYRCHNCGFGGQQLHWVCPSCKSWNTVKPIE